MMRGELWRPADPDAVAWLEATADVDLDLTELATRLPGWTWVEVLHPASLHGPDGSVQAVRWSDIGGGAVPAGVHFNALVGMHINAFENGLDEPNGVWDAPPEQGTLPRRLGHTLRRALTRGRADEPVFAGIWEGWAAAAWLRPLPTPHVTAFERTYMVFEVHASQLSASIDDIGHQAPNLWFPADRGWLLVTDIDDWSTFVGANAEMIDVLVALPGVETRFGADRP